MNRKYWYATAYRRDAAPKDICAGPFASLEEAWQYLIHNHQDDSDNRVFVNINHEWYYAVYSSIGLSLRPYRQGES